MRALQLTIACRSLGVAAQELGASWKLAAGAQARQHSKVRLPMRAEGPAPIASSRPYVALHNAPHMPQVEAQPVGAPDPGGTPTSTSGASPAGGGSSSAGGQGSEPGPGAASAAYDALDLEFDRFDSEARLHEALASVAEREGGPRRLGVELDRPVDLNIEYDM